MTPQFSRIIPLALLALTAIAPAQVGDATLTELDAALVKAKAELEHARQVIAKKAELAELKKALADAKKGKVPERPVVTKTKQTRSLDVLPAWLPKLQSGEFTVFTDEGGAWWIVERRDDGLISTHGFRRGSSGKNNAGVFAGVIERERGRKWVMTIDPVTGKKLDFWRNDGKPVVAKKVATKPSMGSGRWVNGRIVKDKRRP